MDIGASPLLTDLYELAMFQAYLEHGKTETAVFEFFVRKLPPRRGFLIAAGLEQALDFLETLRFAEADLDWLAARGFGAESIEALRRLRFAGDVHALSRRGRPSSPTSRSCGSPPPCPSRSSSSRA